MFDSGPNGVFSLYASPVDPATDGTGFLAGLATANLIGTVSVTNGGRWQLFRSGAERRHGDIQRHGPC